MEKIDIHDIKIEVGQIYDLKFATGGQFKVLEDNIIRDPKTNLPIGIHHIVYGEYVGKEHIGKCPLDITRLKTNSTKN